MPGATPPANLPEGSAKCPHCGKVIVLLEQCSIEIRACRAIEVESNGTIKPPVLQQGLVCEHCSKPIWSETPALPVQLF
jgi:hypothetical protein